jgi:hypothetical protein
VASSHTATAECMRLNAMNKNAPLVLVLDRLSCSGLLRPSPLRRPCPHKSCNHLHFAPAPSCLVVCAVTFSVSSFSPQSPSFIITAILQSQSQPRTTQTTSSPFCAASPSLRAAATRRASTNGMIARSVCPSTTPICPTPKAERAVTFASRIRSAVRRFFGFSAAAAQQRYHHETDRPIIGRRPRLGQCYARDALQRPSCIPFQTNVGPLPLSSTFRLVIC